MRDYGRVHSSFWASPSIARLPDRAKLLALYLLTCPHSTIAGVFRLPEGYVADDLGWPVETVLEGFAQLLSNGFMNRCETTKWVWIVNHLKWNPLDNPNQRKAAAKVAALVPAECAWRPAFIEACGHLLGMGAANPCATVAEGLGQQFANQEQEQEQEQEQKQEKGAARGTRLPQDWTLPDEWRTWAQAERPGLNADHVAAKFRDHWHSVSGARARKADWLATWRNWVREERQQPGATQAGNRPARLSADEVFT